MGDVPGPSTAPYFNQRKATENFSRLCQLIMTICSDLFRDILSRFIKPADLRSELDNNRNRLERIMNAQQKEQIYPAFGSITLTSKDLDISVLYILLRNICNIPKHRAGWGNPPLNGDKRLSACIEKIRIQRNLISSHSVIAAVDDIMFQEHWDELKDAIIEIEKQCVGGDMYERGVNELLSCDLNPGRSRLYVAEFKDIQENMQIKQEKIECLESGTRAAKRKIAVKKKEIKKLKKMTCRTNNHLAVKKMKINKMEKSSTYLHRRINDNKRYIDDQLPLRFQEHERILLSAMQGIIREESEKLQDEFKKHKQEVQEMMGTSFREKKDVWLVILLPSVIKTSSFTIRDVSKVYSIFYESSDKFWVDGGTKILQVDSRGNVLRRLDVGDSDISTNTDGELLFTDIKAVKKLDSNGIITTLFSTDEDIWCIHSSRISGDILLGLYNTALDTTKVTRYDRTGQKMMDIEEDNQGGKLYESPRYITENKNGDIWTSNATKLVVVDKSGKHRFNYRGQQSPFFDPRGICTDILGHVLVCDNSYFDPSVHLLDQDGRFLSLLLTKEHNVHDPRSVCVDDKHNLYLGQNRSNIIIVYKYLQVSKK